MGVRFPERGTLNLTAIAEEILELWEREALFQRSVENRPIDRSFVFYEGPPSANGRPGIHHVMSRTIKDLVCRYQTLKGFRVERKAGWDTHGLPVELGVEKELGITKEDIGTKISVEAYNAACREAVMRYTGVWNDLTRRMGYWVDMERPYVTYDSKYMESVWWLIAQLYDKGLVYKGYTIQPYSPKAGTGLSSHELNQPDAYKMVKDTTVVAQFRALPDCAERVKAHATVPLGEWTDLPVDFLAWTTTPWTLPSNTALAVGPDLEYALVATRNRYTDEAVLVVLASDLVGKHLGESPEVVARFSGADLCGVRYEPLLDWASPMERPEDAFRVIPGDFVTTADGTGMVHIAPTFGADDARAAAAAGVPPMLVDDGAGNGVPLVDMQGRIRQGVGPFAGRYVKQEYYADGEAPERSLDVEIAILLKERGRAFQVEKYEHSYPHCWRTDKPVLYYPLDSWFIRTTAVRDRMMELNETIRWKPASTGSGRFGKWLENVNDWNLSRSRFWGIPLPIWRTEDGTETRCIASVAELKSACDAAVERGWMVENPLAGFQESDLSDENYARIDLHKHIVDGIVLVSERGLPMRRESDLIDVWFDSGAMPYAQWHYPFENQDKIDAGTAFPADFIAEGVDQTRGWFYTLHAIATLVFDQVAYRSVLSNGLVLDKLGRKMSKRLGNGVDPFETLQAHGPDATRWYMMANAQPWENLRFDQEGISETQRKFATLHNTYGFLSLYANIDGYQGSREEVPHARRPELDRWILSRLNSLVAEVDLAYAELEPTRVARAIQSFMIDDLSNWHVRLSRRRFWKGVMNEDKASAYETLVACLRHIAVLGAPIAPFYMDQLYRDLAAGLPDAAEPFADSVHLADFPQVRSEWADAELEARMALAQQLSSLVLGLRKREKLRVRQPLQRIMVPALTEAFRVRLESVRDWVLAEVNVKELQVLSSGEGGIVKRIKPDFKALGPKCGKSMKEVAAKLSEADSAAIERLEVDGRLEVNLGPGLAPVEVLLSEVEIQTEDIPGWLVASEGEVTVALDIRVDEALRAEGITREAVNRIQQLRKESGLEVTDRITLDVAASDDLRGQLEKNLAYLRTEVLADEVRWVAQVEAEALDLGDGVLVAFALHKSNQ